MTQNVDSASRGGEPRPDQQSPGSAQRDIPGEFQGYEEGPVVRKADLLDWLYGTGEYHADPKDGGPVLRCDLRRGHAGPHRVGEVSR